MVFIYKLTNNINGKCYIGQTNNLVKRFSAHKKGKEYISCIHNAIVKYGVDAFSFEVLDKFDTREKANSAEIEYIKEYNSVAPNGYNLELGGTVKEVSELTRERMRQAAKKRCEDPEFLRNLKTRGLKPVICVETGEWFKGVRDAARKLNLCAGHISKVCKGIRKSHNNLTFIFDRRR